MGCIEQGAVQIQKSCQGGKGTRVLPAAATAEDTANSQQDIKEAVGGRWQVSRVPNISQLSTEQKDSLHSIRFIELSSQMLNAYVIFNAFLLATRLSKCRGTACVVRILNRRLPNNNYYYWYYYYRFIQAAFIKRDILFSL